MLMRQTKLEEIKINPLKIIPTGCGYRLDDDNHPVTFVYGENKNSKQFARIAAVSNDLFKALEAAFPYLQYLSDDEKIDPEMETHLKPNINEVRDQVRDALDKVTTT